MGRPGERRPRGNPVGVTLAQSLWLLLELLLGSQLAVFVVFVLLPWVSDRIGLVRLIVFGSIAATIGSTLFAPISVMIAVVLKKVLLGRSRPIRAPVWSGLWVRLWIMRQVVRIVPWGRIAGTEFQCKALRALGARIGQRVHIHGGVNLLQGGWDLLEIGDDVTISQDASIGLVELDEGQVVMGPVSLAAGCTLDIRAGVGPYTRVGRNAWLTALSSLPPGGIIPDRERWDGVPARRVGPAPLPPRLTHRGAQLSPTMHGVLTILARDLLLTVLALPGALLAIGVVVYYHLTYRGLLLIVDHPIDNFALLDEPGVAGLWGTGARRLQRGSHRARTR